MTEYGCTPEDYPFSNTDGGEGYADDVYAGDTPDSMPPIDYLPDQQAETLHEPIIITDRPVAPDDQPDVLSEDLAGFFAGLELPVELNWRMVEYDQLGQVAIEPGLIINGVQMIRYYDNVEDEVVYSVSPFIGHATRAEVLAAENHIATDRISNHLRPKTRRTEFVGSLLNGQAIILPLDTERVPPRHLARSVSWSGEGVEKREGMNVLYTGLLRSSRGKVGQLSVEASYVSRSTTRAWETSYGHLLRGIKILPAMENTEATLDKQYSDSVKNARRIAWFAIKRAYGSGFGTNRRT
jgi:hypothetical protein